MERNDELQAAQAKADKAIFNAEDEALLADLDLDF